MFPALNAAACALLLMLVGILGAASDPLDPGPIAPSANKGRSGTYQVELGGGYNYYVCVPASYSDSKPAGLHIFFHGQGGQGGAPNFDGWRGPFLEAYDLIGINMQYMDGDNGRDTQGKARAAHHALLQTMADYKIVVGRGVICSFSGGGMPHGTLANGYSRTRGRDWPFCHSAIYSSNYWANAAQGCAMSWFVSVGTKEWGLATPTLGQVGTARTGDLYDALRHGGCSDIHFKITKDKGHTITAEEVAASATEFARSDLAFAPFLYLPDYGDKALSGPVRACAALALGPASAMLAKLKAKTGNPPELAAKIDALQSLVDARVARIQAVSTQLCADDPVLASYYLPPLPRADPRPARREGHAQGDVGGGQGQGIRLHAPGAGGVHQDLLRAHARRRLADPDPRPSRGSAADRRHDGQGLGVRGHGWRDPGAGAVAGVPRRRTQRAAAVISHQASGVEQPPLERIEPLRGADPQAFSLVALLWI